MTKIVLLAFGDWALIDEDPYNFAVGRPKVREIKGKEYVTVTDPRYVGDLQTAIQRYALEAPVYLGQVSDGQDLLRTWRRHAGLTQRQLSKLTAIDRQGKPCKPVSVSTIREIEHRRTDPRLSTVDRLFQAIWDTGHKRPEEIT